MKVLRLHAIHDLRLSDEPIPVPGPDTPAPRRASRSGTDVREPQDVLVKIAAVGICGSDAHWYTEGRIGPSLLTTPMVLGHEFTAVVASGKLTGQRVAVDPALPCGVCEFCQEGNPNLCPTVRFAGTDNMDGSMQEYMLWPAKNLHPLPDNLSDVDGTMLEPLGVAMHASRLGPIQPGMSVVVCGCGPIGLMVIQLACLAGAGRIFATDILSQRLEIAREVGATDVFMADGSERSAILDATHKRGVDVAYEVAGQNAAVETAVVASKPGGLVVVTGIPADDRTTFSASTARRKGLTLKIVRRMKHTYPRAIQLVSTGKIDVHSLISHVLPFSEYQKAFDLAERRAGIKVVIEM